MGAKVALAWVAWFLTIVILPIMLPLVMLTDAWRDMVTWVEKTIRESKTS